MKYLLNINIYITFLFFKTFFGDWGLVICDFGLWFGSNPQSPITNS